ncbi:chlorophyll A-B-binding protein [Oscillatoria sp. FACHB-1406]|uniref:chlorophyll A-B-binding protein n=1 Tax=Oscillatoria sp. FACHB-1406 TaxID=2692846 RepID=UPI001681EB48|nr:chlorophyll A-B-binding protein [Oscillatoria sp. FACHB-1406]MBD2579228.1 chlorophyll A-B-binding protein [Oscillatoria sp. FACHB-1406]
MTAENQDPIAQPSNEEIAEPVEQPAFGWTAYAEKINGRFAMTGFILLLLLELWTGQSFWAWLGLR